MGDANMQAQGVPLPAGPPPTPEQLLQQMLERFDVMEQRLASAERRAEAAESAAQSNSRVADVLDNVGRILGEREGTVVPAGRVSRQAESVVEWKAQLASTAGAEALLRDLKERLYTPFIDSPQALLDLEGRWEALESWIRSAVTLQGAAFSDSFLKLGNLAWEAFSEMQAVVADGYSYTLSQLREQKKKNDKRENSTAKAAAALRKQKPEPKRRNTGAKTCYTCGKTGTSPAIAGRERARRRAAPTRTESPRSRRASGPRGG
eukprot:TRINITY_DN6567_c0_g1_i1.p2 TRINITY_DN6567_c0_g1~~TRINITY_DN6567_c0_g1_i1.p2  ORF type:complete len:263 (-),score=10.83 TRINITY_DN6567_c0_g1_i1:942-1730(-)